MEGDLGDSVGDVSKSFEPVRRDKSSHWQFERLCELPVMRRAAEKRHRAPGTPLSYHPLSSTKVLKFGLYLRSDLDDQAQDYGVYIGRVSATRARDMVDQKPAGSQIVEMATQKPPCDAGLPL